MNADAQQRLLELTIALEEFSERLGLPAPDTQQVEELAGQIKALILTAGGQGTEPLVAQLRAILASDRDSRLARGALAELDALRAE